MEHLSSISIIIHTINTRRRILDMYACVSGFVGFGPHNLLDRKTFRGRALADVLIKETEDSDEPIKVQLTQFKTP